MKTIKLMPDYGCWPLWHVSLSEVGDIDPNDLPLSAGLKERLLAWARMYDDTLNWDDPLSSPGFTDEEQARFQREGAELAKLLRGELGPDYSAISKY